MEKALMTDLYQLTMLAAYEKAGKAEELATFDLFVRKLPQSRNYLVACGLEEALQYLQTLQFTEEQIAYLRTLPEFELAPEAFFDRLRNFKFTGEVWAVKEGTPVFGNEPIIAIRAPLYQAQLVETYLLNILGSRTMFASKASRIVDSATPAAVMEFGTRRSHDPEAAIACARAAYITGFIGTSNVEAGKRYGIPVMGTMAHSFVMSFASELEAFRAYANTFPTKTVLLVDTYDIEQGIKNATIVAKEMASRGEQLFGIRIDSNDLAYWSKRAREMFDAEGFSYVKIILSNDLEETKIDELKSQGSQHDTLGVGTMVSTSNDAPHLGVVYKLCEQEVVKGVLEPRIKISEGKTTLPGLKQVYRYLGEDGLFSKDEICLAVETREGAIPLLEKIMEHGKLVKKIPKIEEIRAFARKQCELLPASLRGLFHATYPVEISPRLGMLQAHLIKEAQERKTLAIATPRIVHADPRKLGVKA